VVVAVSVVVVIIVKVVDVVVVEVVAVVGVVVVQCLEDVMECLIGGYIEFTYVRGGYRVFRGGYTILSNKP